jgi:multisubunit Na+/H+ antiporter MnhB subunit
METVIIALVYILLLIFDFLPLVKKRQKKEAVIYGVLILLSLGILAAHYMFEFPSITELISKAVGSVIKIQ